MIALSQSDVGEVMDKTPGNFNEWLRACDYILNQESMKIAPPEVTWHWVQLLAVECSRKLLREMGEWWNSNQTLPERYQEFIAGCAYYDSGEKRYWKDAQTGPP